MLRSTWPLCPRPRRLHLSPFLSVANFAIHSLKRYQDFKKFDSRILVTTDVFGRGMDIERVNIVVNYDMPDSSDTYLHRVARAGRFGTKGLAITFVSTDEDANVLNDVQARFEIEVPQLPDTIDKTIYMEVEEEN